MSRPPSERRSPWPAVVLASALLLLPVLYVLSVGPANWLLQHNALDALRDPVVYFYRPLFWLSDASPQFQAALRWYIGLFFP